MANTYLTRTPSSAGNQKKWTWSAWIKRSKLGSEEFVFYSKASGDNDTRFYFDSNDTFRFQNTVSNVTNVRLFTNRVFRDTSAWYHIVISYDSTVSTPDTNSIQMYVNGIKETSFSATIYPSQNQDTFVNDDALHTIGRRSDGESNYFDGSMSHVHLIDGTAYDATAFGEYDANGVWTINTSPSVTYGTNGFFILKDGNSVTDQSGNSNNFTVGGGTLTKTEDSPSNVFATLNPLDMYYGNSTLSNGNNTQNQSASAGNYAFIPSTLGFSSGKYYWETKCVSGHSDNWYGTGITSSQVNANNNWLGQNANDYSLYGYSYGGGLGSFYTGGTRTNQGLSFTAGDIIGVAVDCDNLAIYFSKNGTWMSNASSVQGVPTSGSSKTGSFFTITAPSSTSLGFYFPALCYYDPQNAVQQTNFGNGYFGTTAVSSAGTNASGIGIFEHDVPTGYTALSTKGLNL